MSDTETHEGAINRAKHAFEMYEGDQSQVEYTVGLEGGCCKDENSCLLTCYAWMAIYHPRQNKWSTTRTASFPLPPKIVDLMENQGMELGEADDYLFKRKNSKQK